MLLTNDTCWNWPSVALTQISHLQEKGVQEKRGRQGRGQCCGVEGRAATLSAWGKEGRRLRPVLTGLQLQVGSRAAGAASKEPPRIRVKCPPPPVCPVRPVTCR
jgi:hypothetical protein